MPAVRCGHCWLEFEIPDGGPGEDMACPGCGIVATRAIPLPRSTEQPTPEQVFGSFATRPPAADSGSAPAEWRALDVWVAIHRGLALGRGATFLSGVLAVPLFLLDLVVLPLGGADALPVVRPLVIGLLVAQVLAGWVHLAGQFCCADVPEEYGGHRAAGSGVVGIFVYFALLGLVLRAPYPAVWGGVLGVLVLVYVVCWLAFLASVSRHLADQSLPAAVARFGRWYAAAVAGEVLFAGLAYAAADQREWWAVWVAKLASACIGTAILVAYYLLLRRMGTAARRARLVAGRG